MAIIETNLNRLEGKVDAGFQRVDSRIDALDKKLDTKVDGLEKKIDAIDKKLDKKVDDLDKKLDKKVDDLDKKIAGVKDSVSALALSTEKGFAAVNASIASVKIWALVLYIALAATLLGSMAKGFLWLADKINP